MKLQQRDRGQGWAITNARVIKLASLLLLLRITSAGEAKAPVALNLNSPGQVALPPASRQRQSSPDIFWKDCPKRSFNSKGISTCGPYYGETPLNGSLFIVDPVASTNTVVKAQTAAQCALFFKMQAYQGRPSLSSPKTAPIHFEITQAIPSFPRGAKFDYKAPYGFLPGDPQEASFCWNPGSEESGQSYKICFQAKNSRGDNAVTFENKLDERCYTIHVSTEGERIQRTIDSTVPEMLEEAVAVVEMQTMSAMEKLKKVDSIDRMVGDLLTRIDRLGGKIDDLQQSVIDGHDEHTFYEEEAHDYSKFSMIAFSLLICLLVCEIVRLRGRVKSIEALSRSFLL